MSLRCNLEKWRSIIPSNSSNTTQNELANDGYLEIHQLPTYIALGELNYTADYGILRYGKIHEDPLNYDMESLDTGLRSAFTASEKAILVYDDSILAFYHDDTSDQYLFFDSHSRDELGFPAPDGKSFAIIFPDIHNLEKFLKQLANKKNVKTYAILPVTITIESEPSESSNLQTHKRSENTEHMCFTDSNSENEPGCSTWEDKIVGRPQDDQIQLKLNQTIQTNQRKRLSRYEKWFQNQTEEKQNEVRARKRQRESNRYPKKAKLKREQAREHSKTSYENPGVRASKIQKVQSHR